VIAGRIERLEELIAVHEEIAGEEAVERADAASFDPGAEAERLRRSQAAKSRELRLTLELFLKMQAAREKRKTSTTEGTENTEGRERRDPESTNEADAGSRTESSETAQATGEEDGFDSTTGGTEGDGPRDEAGRRSQAVGIAGRTIPGRKRITATGAVVGSEKGSKGEKKGASEANLAMIKEVMAQRFSDMPAASRGRERSRIAVAEGCPDGASGEPANPPPAGN
jgi:hypothetical protein